MGLKIVVVTDGANGTYVGTHDYVYYFPVVPVDVVNTTGAGDAFHSCFVATLLRDSRNIEEALENGSLEEAIRFAVINSASVVSFMDTNKGALNYDELHIKSGYLPKNLLQRFPME